LQRLDIQGNERSPGNSKAESATLMQTLQPLTISVKSMKSELLNQKNRNYKTSSTRLVEVTQFQVEGFFSAYRVAIISKMLVENSCAMV